VYSCCDEANGGLLPTRCKGASAQSKIRGLPPTFTIDVVSTAYAGHQWGMDLSDLRSLIDDLPHGTVFQVVAGPGPQNRRFTFMGRSCLAVNGLSAEEAMADASKLYGLILPEHRERLALAEEKALATLSAFDEEVQIRRADTGEVRWMRITSAPQPAADGAFVWNGIETDITDRKHMEESCRRSEERLFLAQEKGQIGLWDWDMVTGKVVWSEGYYRLLGLPAAMEPSVANFLGTIHPQDRDRVAREISEFTQPVAKCEGWESEFRILTPDAHRLYIAARGDVIRDIDQKPVRMIGVCFDVTARRLAEEQQRLLSAEAVHRVKNTLANVLAIIAQTLRGTETPPDVEEKLTARVLSLAQAHEILVRSNWSGASLSELVREAVGVHSRDGDERINVAGPDVQVGPRVAVSLSLALHELGTNAVKYGALSTELGTLVVSWDVAATVSGDRLSLRWAESGGPPVVPPVRRGFGTRLLERGLGPDLGGTARLSFDPAGLVYEVNILLV
jgi:PAS domain S-box-containing protein